MHSCPEPGSYKRTCLLIGGNALIQSLGKPQNCKTFKEYARLFFKSVIGIVDEHIQRVDVVFDTYIEQSIKSATRSKRTKKRSVHKIIDRDDVPLSQVCDNFILLDDNKADLAPFLSEYLISHASDLSSKCELVVSGGFQDPTNA